MNRRPDAAGAEGGGQSAASAQRPSVGATRCVLKQLPRLGSLEPPKPAPSIEVEHQAIRVLDLHTNVLVASTSLAEVTLTPAQHCGIPVMVLSVPGLPTLTIRPHHGAGTWRRSARTLKPNYLATDAEWLGLAERLNLASDLVYDFTPHTVDEHITAFVSELYPENPWTWRTADVWGSDVGRGSVHTFRCSHSGLGRHCVASCVTARLAFRVAPVGAAGMNRLRTPERWLIATCLRSAQPRSVTRDGAADLRIGSNPRDWITALRAEAISPISDVVN